MATQHGRASSPEAPEASPGSHELTQASVTHHIPEHRPRNPHLITAFGSSLTKQCFLTSPPLRSVSDEFTFWQHRQPSRLGDKYFPLSLERISINKSPDCGPAQDSRSSGKCPGFPRITPVGRDVSGRFRACSPSLQAVSGTEDRSKIRESLPKSSPPPTLIVKAASPSAEESFLQQSDTRTLPLDQRRDSLVDTDESHSGSNDMAAGFQRMSGDARRHPSSSYNNRLENQRPMNGQLCRNGPQCRKYQEGTCHFSHDFASMQPNGLSVPKKSLNVESPSFTPTTTKAQPVKLGISPKTAAAPTFTPRGSGSVTPAGGMHSKVPSNEFVPQQPFPQTQQFSEFVPGQSFLPQQQLESPPQLQLQPQVNPYNDPFLSQQSLQQIQSLDDSTPAINPYAQPAPAVAGQQFYPDNSSYKHPLNYHLYASVGPRRENMQPYQRASADFFIPDNLREDLQKKSEASLQTFANSTLPQTVEHFHSLVALDTSSQRSTTIFGYPSWVYKATSSKDGHIYALRRIEGFRLTSEQAIRTSHTWKRVNSASLVQIHDTFTGRWFGDSSLIVVTDYHPVSQTLAEKHFTSSRASRSGAQFVPENELWGYIVQLASALKAVHEAGLAAQTVTASKVLVTSKNRLRLNGCGVLDILRYEQKRPTTELQRLDLEDLGRLILSVAARNPTAHQNVEKSLQFISRTYSDRLRLCLAWLLNPPASSQDELSPAHTIEQAPSASEYNVNNLLTNIADKVVSTMDSTLHQEDELTNNLMRELENGRLVRLLTKLNVILERPDNSLAPTSSSNAAMLNQPSAAWSETGERYYLKLFRDYVFHQVDHDGRPVLDLGHIVTCLNKLDAGVDEKIQLVSRDEQNIMIVSFKEVKRSFESAWTEISKASSAARR